MRFGRFTEVAQDAAMRAHEICTRYGHTQVDTEHLLLALIEQPYGIVAEILEHLHVDSEGIARRLDEELSKSPRTRIYGSGGQVYITPRLKRVIDVSHDQASKLKDDYTSTEALFLAIGAERNTPSARILGQCGITRQGIWEAISQVRGGDMPVASRAGRLARRAVLMPLPLESVTIEMVTDNEPALVLIQGEDKVTVKLAEVLALVGALANAAANLAEVVVRKK